MIFLISGATHSGKTLLAQKLLERYRCPYYSLDLLKMGLIRSGMTALSPEDDGLLTPLLWPIAAEIIKTAIENRQNLIVEGCYIPFDWQRSFGEAYLKEIRYRCLILSEAYIRSHMADILRYESVIEARLEGGCDEALLLRENRAYLEGCLAFGLPYRLIEGDYAVEDTIFEEAL